MTKVLIVDDQPGMCESLAILLRLEGFTVTATTDAREAAKIAARDRHSVVVSDMRMSGLSGLDLMQQVRSVSPSTEFIIMTAYATIETAVQAMQLGAFDYIMKPFRSEAMLAKVRRAIERAERPMAGGCIAEGAGGARDPALVAESTGMQQVLDLVERLAPSPISILVSGETGTGKSLLARHVHRMSPRARGPFVHVNCAALPESLVESELFGHEKGSFTGAQARHQGLFQDAHGGTLFLDEVGLLPTSQQPKLLLALEQRQIRPVGATRPVPVDVRIVAASNTPLFERVRTGEFRQDLYYRLAAATVHIPALRERCEDIPALARISLDRAAQALARTLTLDESVLALLCCYSFPGNVRELDNAMHWAAAVARGETVLPGDLPEIVRYGVAAAKVMPSKDENRGLDLGAITRNAIIECIERHKGSLADAARELGIGRTTLWRRMKEYGLDAGRREGRR